MINLSKTFIIQFKKDHILDIETFASIVRNTNLDGRKFMLLKNEREYANLFKSMKVNAKPFFKIYKKFKRFTPAHLALSQKMIACLKAHKIVLINTTQPAMHLSQLFKDYNYDKDKLRDDVCKAFENDDHSLVINKILHYELNLSKTQRQQIYEVLLYKYFNYYQYNPLEVENVVDLSKTFIRQLKYDKIVDINEYISIVCNNRISGRYFRYNRHSTPAAEFAKLFKTMNAPTKCFTNIYKRFAKCQPFGERIIKCLTKYNICTEENKTKLLQVFKDKLNDEDVMRDEICKTFNKNDQNSILYEILSDLFHFGLRQQIYDILLHEYFQVGDLTVDNIITLLPIFIHQLKLD
eukprot:425990_1